MPASKRESSAEQRRKAAQTSSTLIIPQITPELLEQRRREAGEAARRASAPTGAYEPPAAPAVPDPHAQRPGAPTAPATNRRRIVRQPSRTAQAASQEIPRQTPPAPAAPQPEAAPAPQPAKEKTASGRRTRAQAEAELAETVIHDHIWLNNPILVRGLGLTAVVGAAMDADNALMLSAAAFLLLTATRVTAEAICHLTGYSHRHLSYVYAAALCYIPVYILLYNLFGADLSTLGIYLPLLVVDSAVVKRMEFDDEESIPHAFRLGINNAIGMCISTMLVGCLRELLAAGTVFGYPVLNYAVLPMAGQVAGGFLVVGVLAAGWTAVSAMYVHYKKEEVRRLYAKRKS